MKVQLVGLFLVIMIISVKGDSFSGTNMKLDKESAYCYYYQTSHANITNLNTFMNATSDNLYAYASIYASGSAGIDSTSTQLGYCRPNQYVENTCSTIDDNSFTYISYETQYILVCIECHYWLGAWPLGNQQAKKQKTVFCCTKIIIELC